MIPGFYFGKWIFGQISGKTLKKLLTKTGLSTLHEALIENEVALEQIQYSLVKCRFRGSNTKIKLSKQTFESLNLFNRTVVTRCYLNFVNYYLAYCILAFWEWVLFKNHFLWPSTILNVLIALQAILTSFFSNKWVFNMRLAYDKRYWKISSAVKY